ncbi:glycosyl transferase [Thermococcus chitonophagus]|uniref:Glycosyl transferase n=1 Tax=Thermococcus chitonophagus TaxID=54262 RepID=A0A160VVM9_9EURY|nr:glycosyltransferase family 4 protein [Thermococcus chitonophagus]ASJ17242.1 glycosyl transferase [Thermococcus chitonophagus]CUX77861.1 Glycosyltransferase [Thermococcus chitonophagus]
MESLKIALVSDWYFPKIGGVAVHMHNLAISLRKLGHEVSIVTNNVKTGRERELKELGIDLVKVPGVVHNNLNINWTVFSQGYEVLFEYLNDYDIVHGQHSFTPLSLKAAAAAKTLGKASLVTNHSIDLENSKVLKALARATWSYFRRYLSFPHRVIAVSKAAKEFIKRFTPVPVEVIPNGVDTEVFNPKDRETARDVIERKFGIDTENTVLYVGRLEPRKGVSYLISAMRNVEGKLIIAGDGGLRPLLERKARELKIQARFLGKVSYSDLVYLYKAVDVFVLPSLSEAFGIVLIEAMASGTPVIGTSVGGIPEIIDGCGILVKPKNPSELAEAINTVLSNQEIAKKLGRLGRIRAEAVYSWKVIAKRTLKTYREVLDGEDNTNF